jgi:predicted TIM-barrel fold metal-dependent hydrolase
MSLLQYLWANASAGVCPCAPPCACDWAPADWAAATSGAALGAPAKFVFVEVDVNSTQWLEEAAWVQSVADGPGGGAIGGIVAAQPPGFGRAGVSPGAIDAALAALLDAAPLARGIRASGVNYSDPAALAALLPHAAVLAARGLSLDVNTGVAAPGAGAGVAALAAAVPDGVFVLDHAGSPPVLGTPAEAAAWQAGLAAAASSPNVVVKLGGILQGFKAGGALPAPAAVAPWVAATLSTFGFNRTLFEGNWFFTDWLNPADLDVWRAWAGMADGFLTAAGAPPGSAQRDAVLRGTGARVYRVDV